MSKKAKKTQVSNVTEQPNETAEATTLEAPPAVATEAAEAGAPVVETVPPMPPLKRPLIEIADERSENDAKLDALEREKKRVMENYREEIGILEARSSELRAEYSDARWPKKHDYVLGKVWTYDGRTGECIKIEDLPAGTQLPLPEPTSKEPDPDGLVVGNHYRLMNDDIEDGYRLVTITSLGADTIEVRWAHSGLDGSVPRSQFAGAEAAIQEDIDSALVAPAKGKNKRSQEAAE